MFFVICDEATGLAEKYAQKKATALERLEKIVIADIIGLVCLLAYELIKAVKYAAQNKALKKKSIWTRQPDFRIRTAVRRS